MIANEQGRPDWNLNGLENHSLPTILAEEHPDFPGTKTGCELYATALAVALADPERVFKAFVLDQLEQAVPFTWLRRAVVFDAVPLPEVAAACRRKAALLFSDLDPSRDLLTEAERLGVRHV
jgi:hypothetical protein